MPVAICRASADRLFNSALQPISRPEVKEQNGLEVPRQLQWTKWSAGGEFNKVLCIKNVSTDVIKFTYKLLPHESPFSVEYPEPRRLSPGMSTTIKVAFRPSKRQAHACDLELLSGGTSILVPLLAVLPASKLQLQSAVDFGCVPVRQRCMQQLPIKNVGDAGLSFTWRLQEPFAVIPAAGHLDSGQSMVCEVHFDPQEAAAFRVAAACSLDNGELLTVQVSGMAKFPFLSLEKDCVDMGDVVVGQTAEAYVRFGNHSPVPANFFLAAGPGSHDGTITVQPNRGSLQPNEYSMMRIVFAPRTTGAFSCDSFILTTEGGNKLSLTCKGTAVAPQLRLSAYVYAFGNVRSGHTPSKTLYMQNESDLHVQYQFLTEPAGVFTLSRPHGIVPPRSMAHTAVKFSGAAPGNYYQRIVCLVKDGEPQAIDALASCYDDTSRPPPLSYKHIQVQISRAAAGMGPVAAGQSSEGGAASAQDPGSGERASSTPGSQPPAAAAAASGTASDGGMDLEGSSGAAADSDPGQLQLGSSGGAYCEAPGTAPGWALSQQQQQQQQQLAGPASWQVLFEGLEALQPAVTVSSTLLDFGCCSRLTPAEPQSFQVTNQTSANLVVSLVVPGWVDPVTPTSSSGKALQQVFTAFPESLELRPQASGTFRLAFRPPRDGQYYSQTVMLVSSIKAMRSFRLVQDHQVVPPWSCALLACGNTFASVNPELSPKVSVSSTSVSFPPCHLSEAVYQTLCLTNHGDTPVHFAFTARGSSASHNASASRLSGAAAAATGQAAAGGSGSSGSSSSANAGLVAAGLACFGQFAVLPVQGVLEPQSQQLVAVRFKPCDLNPAGLKLHCVFNHSATNSAAVQLSGTASEPRLVWDVPDNCLFFGPTCVGARSQRQLTVRNASKVPVGWQWVLSKKLQDAVAVEPQGGLLRGYDSVKLTVSFSPVKQGLHSARAALLLLPTGTTSAAAATQSQQGLQQLPPAAGSAGAAGASVVHVTPTAVEYGEAAAADLDAEDCQPEQAAAGSNAAPGSSSGGSRYACEKLIMTIVGEATQGALSTEPTSLAFGNINVGYPQHKTLRVINQSGGVLRYHVTVVDDNPAGIDCAEVACEFGSAAEVLAAAAHPAGGCSSSSAGSSTAAVADCWLDAPEGVVNARASKSLLLTLLPRRRGQYRLRLNLHAASLPKLPHGPSSARSLLAGSTGSSPAGSPRASGRLLAAARDGAESPLKLSGASTPANSPSPRGVGILGVRHSKTASCSMRSSLGAVRLDDSRSSSSQGAGEPLDAIRAARSARPAQGRSSGSGGAAAAVEDDMASAADSSIECAASAEQALLLERPPLAMAAVTADASFPSLLFTDVFCEGLPKQVAWQMLGLSQLNAELCCPVSTAEVQAQQLADKGQLSNDNAASLLPPFPVDLGVTTAGRCARQFELEVKNNGVLPLEWELHSYDAPQVDLENWVEPARPLTQAEKERAFIIDNNLFEVLPKHGCLPAGQAQQVVIRVNPVTEGSYCLPLFLRIKDGKQLQLQLSAQVVSLHEQLALAVRGSHSLQLVAAPIGELQPPLQQYTLRNAGPAALQYRLDTTPLQELAKRNYSAEVIKYAGGSPLEGEVAPSGVAVFNWWFQPLEANDYSVALPLSLGGMPPQPLLLHGRGYHPTQHPEQAAPATQEAAQHWQDWLGFSQHPAATAHHCEDLSLSLHHDSSHSHNNSSNSSSGRWLLSSPEVLDLGVCLPASSAKQLLTLTNTAAVPMEFAWQFGVFEAQRRVMSGQLSVIPTSGVLEPGEARVCQVSFEAGLTPQLFSGEIYCHAAEAQHCSSSSPKHALAGAAASGQLAQGLTLQQWQALGDSELAADEGCDEVIAQDPPRQRMPPAGKVLRERLPLHLSMTQSACNRFEALKQGCQQALTLRSGAGGSIGGSNGGGSSDGTRQQCVLPQLLTVTVQGAVLCKAHINADSYMRAPDVPKARKLLAVAHLLTTVSAPVSLPPAQGALGPCAAAERAAQAAAAAAAEAATAAEEEGGVAEEPGEQAGAATQAVGMAGAVLEELLADVWAESTAEAAAAAAALSGEGRQPLAAAGGAAAGAGPGQAALGPQQGEGSAAAAEPGSVFEFCKYVLDSAILGTLQEGQLLPQAEAETD